MSAPIGNKNAAGHHVAHYNGKSVTMDYVTNPKDQFKYAAMRIQDNGASEGVVQTPKGEYFHIKKGSRSAIKINEEQAREVISRVGATKASAPSTRDVVRAEGDAVTAAGTSEGARKGWQERMRHAQDLSHKAYAASSAVGNVHKDKVTEAHKAAMLAHSEASNAHQDAMNKAAAEGAMDYSSGHAKRMDYHDNQYYYHKEQHDRLSGVKSSNITATDVIHCRASGASTDNLQATEWRLGETVAFMWMPAGVHTITAGFRSGSINLTVACDQQTADAVNASLRDWRDERPKQEPFGCVEHREQEASVRVGPSCGFEWRGDGVYLAAEPTKLGADNVNGKVHRSWSPSFTTDADYGRASEQPPKSGVLVFPEGVRGSRSNPARITGVDFCVGTLTNKPAFHSMSPVKAKEADAVTAAGTSEGAKKGWEHRDGFAATERARVSSEEAEINGHYHGDAFLNHKFASEIHSELGNKDAAKVHEQEAARHSKLHRDYLVKKYNDKVASAKATDPTLPDSVRAHCRLTLLQDVPDATEAELKQYEEELEGGGSHADAVIKLRSARQNGFKTTGSEKPTLDTIAARHAAKVAEANRIAEANGAAKLTAADVYERHTVTATGTSEGARKGWLIREGAGFKTGHAGQDFARARPNEHIRLSPDEYAEPGHVIGYIKARPDSQLGFMRGSHNNKTEVRVHVRKEFLSEMSDGAAHRPTGETMIDHPHASEVSIDLEKIYARAGANR